MTLPVIGYAGMTHLGLNSAVATAEKGFETVCYDAGYQKKRHIGRAVKENNQTQLC